MNTRRCLLFAYRALLWFYPSRFRTRFSPEMMELAEAAEMNEWPLILGDTSIAILRCWLQGPGSTTVPAEPGAYLSIGGASVPGWGLLQGLILSIVIVGGLWYANYRVPAFRPCPGTSSVTARR